MTLSLFYSLSLSVAAENNHSLMRWPAEFFFLMENKENQNYTREITGKNGRAVSSADLAGRRRRCQKLMARKIRILIR